MVDASQKAPFQADAKGQITELKGTPLPSGILHLTVNSPSDAIVTAISSENVVRGAYRYAELLRPKSPSGDGE
jgi:hypothetical protein